MVFKKRVFGSVPGSRVGVGAYDGPFKTGLKLMTKLFAEAVANDFRLKYAFKYFLLNRF